jgi:uncharacterized protein (DUF1499 family)
LALDADHRIEPLQYEDNRAEAKERLLGVLRSLKRVKIVVVEPSYIHAEFTSALFGFVDDVEFLFASAKPVIHLRSASRVGYYDFGANRSRVEQFRAEWTRQCLLHEER